MAGTFDDLQTLNAMFAQSLAPINRLGSGQVAIAQEALKNRQQIEEEMRKNLLTQSILEQQHRFQAGRDKLETEARMKLLQEQNRLLGERQKLDDERAAKKALDQEAASAGVEPKGKTPEAVRKEIDEKLAGSVQADIQKRSEYAQRVVEIMRRSSATAKARITQKALAMPEVVKNLPADAIIAMKNGSLTIDQVVEHLANDYISYVPFYTQGKAQKAAAAAFTSWTNAYKQVAELDKENNPDYQLAADMSNLQGRIQNLDSGIAEKYHKITNPDVRANVFPELAPLPPWVDPNRTPAPPPVRPPVRPLSNVPPVLPPVSPTGAVIPQTRSPYVQEFPP